VNYSLFSLYKPRVICDESLLNCSTHSYHFITVVHASHQVYRHISHALKTDELVLSWHFRKLSTKFFVGQNFTKLLPTYMYSRRFPSQPAVPTCTVLAHRVLI